MPNNFLLLNDAGDFITINADGDKIIISSFDAAFRVPSFHQSSGLSIHVSDPLIKTNRSPLTNQLTNKVDSYSQEIRRVGGYWQASLRMNETEDKLNDWIQNGIGRHIEVYNPALVNIWEGFVNKISINMGEDTYSVGPLVNIGNRITVTYSTIDTTTDPPTLGSRVNTAVANNTDSQTKYGIWHKFVGINGATSTQATQLRDKYVNDPLEALPNTSGNLNLGRGGSVSMSIQCLGYWAFLKAYRYANSATGNINLSQKIQDIINADVNSIFSTDFSKVTSNTTQVKDYSKGQQTAETILKNLVNQGDSSDNPYSIGFYANRRLVYKQIPTEIKYQRRRGQPITTIFGGNIKPWDIQPAEWLFKPDFLVGRVTPVTSATLGSDPRSGLIESVKFSSPYTVTVNGIKLSELDQVLAKRGMGSVG